MSESALSEFASASNEMVKFNAVCDAKEDSRKMLL